MSTPALDRLRSARKIGLVLSGGSARCSFQVGVLETLEELGIRPAFCVAVSGGVWNGAPALVEVASLWPPAAEAPEMPVVASPRVATTVARLATPAILRLTCSYE